MALPENLVKGKVKCPVSNNLQNQKSACILTGYIRFPAIQALYL